MQLMYVCIVLYCSYIHVLCIHVRTYKYNLVSYIYIQPHSSSIGELNNYVAHYICILPRILE